jgi:hypothetical protein
MAVEARRSGNTPRRYHERAGQPNRESSGVDRQEKLMAELMGRPYRKPTQVGEASSLR